MYTGIRDLYSELIVRSFVSSIYKCRCAHTSPPHTCDDSPGFSNQFLIRLDDTKIKQTEPMRRHAS